MPTSWRFTSPAVSLVTAKAVETTAAESRGKRRRQSRGAVSSRMSPYSSGRGRMSNELT